MCDYNQVKYECGHCRYTVRSWCSKYRETHVRCPPKVVAYASVGDKCGDCKDSSPIMYDLKNVSNRRDRSESGGGSGNGGEKRGTSTAAK